MIQVYLFSFIPVIALTVAMYVGINKKQEYGGRSRALLVSLLLITFVGILATIVELNLDKNYENLRIIFLLFTLIAYSLSILVLEYSVHSQRIKLSYLSEDVKVSLKFYKIFMIISLVLALLSILVQFMPKNDSLIMISELVVITLLATNLIGVFVVFNFRKGVLRKKNYPFIATAIVMSVYVVLLISSYSSKTMISFVPLIILNLIFIIRCFEEYVFFRTEHMQYMLIHEAKLKKESSKIINKIILSDKQEDSKIIHSVVSTMLSNIKSELVIDSHGITGILTFRLFGGYFRLDSEEMIQGYCTPLSELLSIKQVNTDTIHKKLMGTKYSLEHILETSLEDHKDFGAKYLKKMIDEKQILIMDKIPTCYRGLQKMIAFVPIFNEDKIAGFQVVFKSNYDKLYYFERKSLKATSYTLNTIFSIVNGKQVQEERNRLMGEMNIAKDIQTSIIPKTMELDGYTIACNMVTATEVGGDAYDFIKNKYGNYFSIGDVSGHGLPSGITALIFLTSLQAALDAAEVLGSKLDVDKAYDIINRVLCTINRDRIGSDKFMTGNVFREDNGTLHYAGAHEIAVQYCKKDNQVILHKGCTEKTAFLGLSEFIKSETSIGSLTMESGDVLLLYTDGVIEAKDENAVQYGIENVEALLFENQDQDPEIILELLKNEVIKYAEKGDIKQNGGSLSDDISMVIIKKN